MMTVEALIDSNVLIASVVLEHRHQVASSAFLRSRPLKTFAVAAHSVSEVYSNLTRKSGPAPLARQPAEARAIVDDLMTRLLLLGLTPAETLDAIRAYAAQGGIGPRLYDRLIGEVAVLRRIPRIVTWNVAHMRGLFPAFEVLDPEAALQRSR